MNGFILILPIIFIRYGIVSFFGLAICFTGMSLYAISIVHFAKPNENGLNTRGIYKISRNPMYIAFFLYFLGGSILINSWILFFILVIFQISVHELILSEERWCIEQFGEDSISDYILLNRVFRYLKQGAKLITMSNSEYYITENGPMLVIGAFTRMFEQHAKSKQRRQYKC